VASEPRVEELLATIRRAIDRDINELDARDQGVVSQAPQPPPLRSSLKQDAPAVSRFQERNADTDISSLRHRVHRHKLETRVELSPPVLSKQPSLFVPQRAERPQVPTYAPEPVPYYPPQAEPWPEPVDYVEQPDYAQQAVEHEAPAPQDYSQQPLLSPQTAYATQASFQALTNAMISQLGGDSGLQERARELLKPMLKHWLDENLPNLVERIVRDEIERVARRGR